jgi:hypothetical protein
MSYSKDVAAYPIWMHELLDFDKLPTTVQFATEREARNARFRIYAFVAAMRHQFPGPRADEASRLTVRITGTQLTILDRETIFDPLREVLLARQLAKATSAPIPNPQPIGSAHEDAVAAYLRGDKPRDNSK